MYTIHCTVCILQYMYGLHCTPYIIHNVLQRTMYDVYTLYPMTYVVHCTMYSGRRIMDDVHNMFEGTVATLEFSMGVDTVQYIVCNVISICYIYQFRKT